MHGHGQSEYTPTKQKHLQGILEIGKHGWNPKWWTHKELIIIDCTSGNGKTEEGNDGSPIIINRFFTESKYPFRQLCCEREPSSFTNLQQTGINADLRLGQYQEIVPEWLQSLQLTKPALGFLYCDPNGAKDLLAGYEMFQELASTKLYERMDFLFHWSLTAYQRNFGAGIDWANKDLSRIICCLRKLKKHAVIREPVGKQRWVIMYMLNTDKIDGQWRNEGFFSADKWIEKYLCSKNQLSLFNDDYDMTKVSA